MFKDVLIESNIIGQGSIKGVMTGKHYNRSVHCHKIMSEALHRLRFQAFLDCLDDEDSNDVATLISDLLEDFPNTRLLEKVQKETFQKIMKLTMISSPKNVKIIPRLHCGVIILKWWNFCYAL